MNLTWKDLVVLGLGAIVVLLAAFKLIDLMYLKDKNIEVAVVGFVGTIIGGVLSGAITLIGVKLTIQENRRKDMDETLPRKIVNANHFMGQASDILRITKFNLDAMKGKYVKLEDLSKLNIDDIIEAHNRIREKILEFLDNAINDSALNVSFEVYEKVINFSNEFEEINNAINEVESEYYFNCLIGREDEKQTMEELIDFANSYIKIIKKLIIEVENEKTINLNKYYKNKST